VVYNAEKESALSATRWKNNHELKLEHFSALLPTTRENDQRCRQQRGTLFCVVGNNEEKYSAL
jgi:hypothetical protein